MVVIIHSRILFYLVYFQVILWESTAVKFVYYINMLVCVKKSDERETLLYSKAVAHLK